MTATWQDLLPHLEMLRDLGTATTLLEWDQLVMMPSRGAAARARTLATLEAMSHARLIAPDVGELIQELTDSGDLDGVQAAHVRVLKRYRDKATRVPEKLVRALAEARGLSYQTWTEARPKSDFGMLRPHLERLVSLKKEEADAVGYATERYDALLDIYEPDSTTVEIESMFSELVEGLEPLSTAILDRTSERPRFLTGNYDEGAQQKFCSWLVERLGFDTEGGRLDTSPHPFTVGISAGDVRQTTRTESKNVLGSIYAAIHETGHALYEQGIPAEMWGLPAGHAPSLGMHESQSRLWENHVGRSRAFTDFMLPRLKELFGDELGNVTPEDFHRGVNHPERTLIRVNADEVTYNLHVINRFEIELALFRDELDVSDLPGAWNDAMERRLGIRPDHDGDGVLQDMHWPTGTFGYFPTYSIGTLFAAAFYEKATADLGDIEGEIRAGDTSRLLDWLQKKVYAEAYLRPGRDLAASILGGPVSPRPFLQHLRDKYSALYGAIF
jgi:carboxypeptidase Taq